MNRLVTALTLSASLISLAGVSLILLGKRESNVDTIDVEPSDSRSDELERRLSEFATELKKLKVSGTNGEPQDLGSSAPSEEKPDELGASLEETLLARLETMEARLRGLEGDPVHRALSYIVSANPELRQQGVESLASLAKSDPDARAALRDMLKDGDADVRMSALKALTEAQDRDSAVLVSALLDDENAEVRREAIRTLASLGDVDSAAEIASYINDENDEVRRTAVDAMGKLEFGESAAALITALDDPNIGVRGEAISSLGEIGAKESLPRLRELYAAQENGEHREDDQRVGIAMAMKQLGDDSAVQAEIERLGHMVHYNDHPGAMRALMYVGRNQPAARQYFARAAEASNVEWIRREARRMLEPDPQSARVIHPYPMTRQRRDSAGTAVGFTAVLGRGPPSRQTAPRPPECRGSGSCGSAGCRESYSRKTALRNA